MSYDVSVLADFAYTEILNMIISAEIQPSERIREDILAEKLGISRTPVREAIKCLTQNGLIQHVKRKGLYCVDITEKDLLDLLDLRLALESLSFDKLIEHASEQNLDDLQLIINDFYKKLDAITNGDKATVSRDVALLHNEFDVRFHVTIAQISQSIWLIKYIQEVENLLLVSRQRIYRNESGHKVVMESWKQHELMLEGLKNRDGEQAKKVLRQHLMLMRETQESADKTTKSTKEVSIG